ncbi:MAG: hypothetical protein HFG63_03575 [Lachnospiraceae bacterium]|nr:hypothetical protein [Lachnospiraceae bacterium]
MSLVDKLMAIDRGDFAKEKTGEVRAKHLSEVMGGDVKVTIKALKGDLYNEIMTRMIDKKGRSNFGKAYDINAILCVEGVVEPDLKNADLQKHFGCASPKDLAKLFFPGGELTRVADEITDLSGFSKEGEEEEEKEELKN